MLKISNNQGENCFFPSCFPYCLLRWSQFSLRSPYYFLNCSNSKEKIIFIALFFLLNYCGFALLPSSFLVYCFCPFLYLPPLFPFSVLVTHIMGNRLISSNRIILPRGNYFHCFEFSSFLSVSAVSFTVALSFPLLCSQTFAIVTRGLLLLFYIILVLLLVCSYSDKWIVPLILPLINKQKNYCFETSSFKVLRLLSSFLDIRFSFFVCIQITS